MPSTFRHKVPMLGMGQPNQATCWFASYKMIFTYLQRNNGEITDKLQAAKIDVEDAKNKGLADTDYRAAAIALGLDSWPGSKFNLTPGKFDFGLSDGAEAFLDQLQLGPLWVSRKAGSNYHAVVAVGYDDDDRKIVFNNPWPGPSSAVEQRLEANLFVRNISGAGGSVQAWRYHIQ